MLLGLGHVVGLLVQHAHPIFRSGVAKLGGTLVADIGLTLVNAIAKLAKLEPF
jgi:hypothetical protein